MRRNILVLLILAFLSALAAQTLVGERGLQARSALKTRIAGLNKKLVILRDKRQKLEQLTKLMSPDEVDPDMLEYQARQLLGFVHENERVFVRKKN